jgi:hypothetical protein
MLLECRHRYSSSQQTETQHALNYTQLQHRAITLAHSDLRHPPVIRSNCARYYISGSDASRHLPHVAHTLTHSYCVNVLGVSETCDRTYNYGGIKTTSVYTDCSLISLILKGFTGGLTQ